MNKYHVTDIELYTTYKTNNVTVSYPRYKEVSNVWSITSTKRS